MLEMNNVLSEFVSRKNYGVCWRGSLLNITCFGVEKYMGALDFTGDAI